MGWLGRPINPLFWLGWGLSGCVAWGAAQGMENRHYKTIKGRSFGLTAWNAARSVQITYPESPFVSDMRAAAAGDEEARKRLDQHDLQAEWQVAQIRKQERNLMGNQTETEHVAEPDDHPKHTQHTPVSYTHLTLPTIYSV